MEETAIGSRKVEGAPPAEVISPSGELRYGLYRGAFTETGLSRVASSSLSGRLRRLMTLKRWHYACVATDDVLAGFAFVHLGYAANAFAFAVDLRDGRRIADQSFLGIPGATVRLSDRPTQGMYATYRGPGASMRLERRHDSPSFEVNLETGGLSIDAVLDADGGPDPMSLVYRVGGGPSCTQKFNLLPVAGVLRVGSRTWNLGGGFGGLDYSEGYFARETAWRWGFGLGRAKDGTPVGFNVAEGLAAPTETVTENVLWVGDELVQLGAPRFTFDAKNPAGPWQLRTEDGALDLRFSSAGMHAEEKNLAVVRSHFVQVGGVFSGTVRALGRDIAIERLPGVTEDQRVAW